MQKLIKAFMNQMEVVKSHFKLRKTLKLHPHQQLIMDDLKQQTDHIQVIKWPVGGGKT